MKRSKKQVLDINNADHPYRQMAVRIIEEVVEPITGVDLRGVNYYRMEDDIVALLTNLDD